MNTFHAHEHTRRLLIADTCAPTRFLYHKLFGVGWDVVEASDGRDALAKALTRAPTLIITELQLPNLDGFALCDILRRDHATAMVPILVVTVEDQPARLRRAKAAGANIVLTKAAASVEMVLSAAQGLIGLGAVVGPDTLAMARPGDVAAHPTCSECRDERRLKSFARFTTTTPSHAPPELLCPSCGEPLVYQHSYLGGVSDRHREQWDHYQCPANCGSFEYRQRTRRLRRGPTLRSA